MRSAGQNGDAVCVCVCVCVCVRACGELFGLQWLPCCCMINYPPPDVPSTEQPEGDKANSLPRPLMPYPFYPQCTIHGACHFPRHLFHTHSLLSQVNPHLMLLIQEALGCHHGGRGGAFQGPACRIRTFQQRISYQNCSAY